MKEYEQKICNIMDNMKAEIRYQCDRIQEQSYKQGYATGYDHGKQDGYEDGKAATPFTDTEEAEKNAYNRGLDDAWDVARKIIEPKSDGGYSFSALLKVFDEFVIQDIFKRNTAAEAIAKIKAYEDKQKQDAEIKVGDEVQSYDTRYIVVRIRDNGTFEAIGACGTDEGLDLSNFHKTGRHFPQIAEVLAELRGAENDE